MEAEDDTDSRLFSVFMDVQRGLPRQGPGCRDSTLRALALCRDLPDRPDVLDIGCGPGLQTLALASALDGTITAVDAMAEYLDQLGDSASAAGVGERVRIIRADMADLPYAPDSFDLIWCEGAAYIMGVAEALTAWLPLLRPRGYLALTELTWLTDQPPAEAAAFFADEYPAMTDVATNVAKIRDGGYELLGHFTLPDSAWWDDYYTPLEAKLPEVAARYAGDADAEAVITMTRREIEMRRRFGASYGYEMFVARRASGDRSTPR